MAINTSDIGNGDPSESQLLGNHQKAIIGGESSQLKSLNTVEENSFKLETDDERRKRKKSHLIVYFTTFIMSIGFSIVITGVWPFLQKLDSNVSKEFLGWVLAANPFGQMVAAPLLGWYASKAGSSRGAFVVTISSFIIGNVLYALLPLFKTNVKYIMMFSRFVVGVSSANIALCRSYIASSTTVQERTFAISITAASQSMGFILGPSIQTIMAVAYQNDALFSNETDGLIDNETFVGRKMSMVVDDSLPFINMYTLAAWCVALLGSLNLFLFLPCVYKECNIALEEAKREAKNNISVNTLKVDYVAVGTIILTFFCILSVFVLVETIIVPMCLDMYAWTPEFAVKAVGIGLSIAGLLSLIMFIVGGKLANIFSDRVVYLTLGVLPLTFAMLSFLPLGKTYPKIKYCDDNPSNAMNVSDKLYSNFSNIRSKRHIATSNCAGLGCPSSQDWCLNTVIIEIPQLITACFLTTLGYPVAVSLSNAIYSKLIGPKSQGLWMGVLTSAGSLSRVIGPIFVTFMYTAKGPFWTFLFLFFLLFFILLLNFYSYKRLVPLSFGDKNNVTDDLMLNANEQHEEQLAKTS